MDGVSEDAVVFAEDGVGAVALVRVGVGNENAKFWVCFVQVADGHGDVVEHAVSEAPVGKGVMCSAGKIRGHSVRESIMARGNRGCGFQ